jgi:LPXTG-motif cell wall-anchored protein
VSNQPSTPAPSAAPATPTVLPSTGTSRWLPIALVSSLILIGAATVVLRRMRA